MTMKPLPLNSTIGIVGGGQLGRMSALAAYQLGYRVHILTPDENAPAAQIAAATIADLADTAAAAAFAAKVDVITFEFEKVAEATIDTLLAAETEIRPAAACLRLAQNRILEKQFVAKCGFRVADWEPIYSEANLMASLSPPFILKHALFGYDGKGQQKITTPAQAMQAVRATEGPWVAEQIVKFDKELSCIVARGADGSTATYDVCENLHRRHILKTTTIPAEISPAMAEEAAKIATHLAAKMDLVGLLSVEFFKVGDELVVNEFAPRPHNSGHWTNDAAVCSQFEQLVRAVCGLPLGSTRRLADVTMTNLLGDEATDPVPHLKKPLTKFWAYCKQPRENRKVGHINELRPFRE